MVRRNEEKELEKRGREKKGSKCVCLDRQAYYLEEKDSPNMIMD